jgi:hypothetical protein
MPILIMFSNAVHFQSAKTRHHVAVTTNDPQPEKKKRRKWQRPGVQSRSAQPSNFSIDLYSVFTQFLSDGTAKEIMFLTSAMDDFSASHWTTAGASANGQLFGKVAKTDILRRQGNPLLAWLQFSVTLIFIVLYSLVFSLVSRPRRQCAQTSRMSMRTAFLKVRTVIRLFFPSYNSSTSLVNLPSSRGK